MKKNKFKGFSQIIITIKTKLVVTILFISTIFKDAWFIDYRASQHLTFKRKYSQPLRSLFGVIKYILKTTLHLMYVGNASLSSTCQMGFPNVLEMCCMFQSWQKIYYRLVN